MLTLDYAYYATCQYVNCTHVSANMLTLVNAISVSVIVLTVIYANTC